MIKKAIVTNNNDIEQRYRIQVRILPDLKDVEKSMLPWVYPFFPEKNIDIPENDDMIYVIVPENDLLEINIKYLPKNTFIRDNAKYSNFTNLKSKVTESNISQYPQPCILDIFPDGSAEWRDTQTGEYVVLHKDGSYIMLDSAGKYVVYTKDHLFKIYSNKCKIEETDSNLLVQRNESKINLSDAIIELDQVGNKITLDAVNLSFLNGTEPFVLGNELYIQWITLLSGLNTFLSGLNITTLSGQASAFNSLVGTLQGIANQIKSTNITGK